MKHTKEIAIFFLTPGLVLLSCSSAKADSLSLSITPNWQMVSAGNLTPLIYYGTVTDTDGIGTPALNLVGDNINITLSSATPTINLPSTDAVDDSSFLSNWPLSMNPGDTYTGELFAVTISDPTTETGLYQGTFQIVDGSSAELATGDFSFTVTPEPSSLLLLVSGLAGLASTLRRTIKA